jgi:hypothetical protein
MWAPFSVIVNGAFVEHPIVEKPNVANASRRQFLGGGTKAGFGLALWKELNLGTVPAFAFTPAKVSDDIARFQPAFACPKKSS